MERVPLDVFSDLNEPQRRAVAHVDGPLLVLAGAGSGKTRVITRRVAHLIAQGVPPWNVLAITFTNKAAGEMRERIEALGVPRGAMACTFHSLCARLLREFAHEAQLSRNYSIYDRADQLRLTKEAMVQLDLSTSNFTPAAVHATISNAKNALHTPNAFAQEAGDFFGRNVAKVYRRYERLLAEKNALDFDDLLLRMAFLLRDHPDIRKVLSSRYRYILIDEYQDTNHAQYVIARGIAADHDNVCATGDPDQSIYGWRGADINNILEFEKDFPNAVVIRLEENYRSTKPILAAASRLITHNRRRKNKALWTRRTGGAAVRVLRCDDEHAEARILAERFAERRAAGKRLDEVAVFYRVNSLSRVLEEAMLGAGIPYRVARGVEFYNRKEIKDVLAYLKLLVNPSDDLSCLRIINVPARGIGQTTVKRLAAAASLRGISVLAACADPSGAGLGNAACKKVEAFVKLIASLSADLARPVREIVEDVYRRGGMEESLGARDEEHRQARANVDELVSTAAQFDESVESGTLVEYLQQVALVSDVDHFEGAGGAVTLMTLHAAKGLEFPVVHVIGCEAGLLPFQRQESNSPGTFGIDSERLEEERRLAFVGMTRAKDELTLSLARSRMIRGMTTPQAPSQFLGEIGTEDVTFEDKTTTEGTPAVVSAARREQRRRGGFYADVEERRLIEATADAVQLPPEYEYLRVGGRVRHSKYGVGKVLSVSREWPETRAEIDFINCGRKKLVLSKTSLELL